MTRANQFFGVVLLLCGCALAWHFTQSSQDLVVLGGSGPLVDGSDIHPKESYWLDYAGVFGGLALTYIGLTLARYGRWSAVAAVLSPRYFLTVEKRLFSADPEAAAGFKARRRG